MNELFCKNLPTKPIPGMGKILVTGVSGYVGGHLVVELLARGYQLRLMVRGDAEAYKRRWPNAEIVVANALDPEQVKTALRDIEIAYYLIHSLNMGPKRFESADHQAALNFKDAAEENQVKRIIYLGGLGDVSSHLSHHLGSRIDTAINLIMGKVPVTTLRAAVIFGSGGSSYEIIHHLVKKLPILLPPPWAKNKCQPIALRDLIKYLVGVLEVPETAGGYYDVGGRDILTYDEMLKDFAKIMNKKMLFISSPFNAVSLYSYISSLITPLPYTLIRCLFESLQNETVCLENSIRDIIPFQPLSYKEMILEAITEEKLSK
ncbi:MAG: NAD(P)H-binding protein [Candidatus Omnitrophota bacterium]|nr:NAD(P)H-binding protein [Candidatus Omnitrophota bacterium]